MHSSARKIKHYYIVLNAHDGVQLQQSYSTDSDFLWVIKFLTVQAAQRPIQTGLKCLQGWSKT